MTLSIPKGQLSFVSCILLLLAGFWLSGIGALGAQVPVPQSAPKPALPATANGRFDIAPLPPAIPAAPWDPQSGVFRPVWKSQTEPVRLLRQDGGVQIVEAVGCNACDWDPMLPTLPRRTDLIPVQAGTAWVASVSSSDYQDQTPSLGMLTAIQALGPGLQLANPNLEWYPAQPVQLGEPIQIRKQWYQPVTVFAAQVNLRTQTVRTFSTLRYQLQRQSSALTANASGKASAGREWVSQSALAQGRWFRLGVIEDGVYRVDANVLRALGLNPAQVNPLDVRIHGYGGGMLPQLAGAPLPDDLPIHAVQVLHNGDGSFDDGEAVLFYAQGPHGWYYNTETSQFRHELNVYADSAYYFLTVDGGAAPAVTSQTSLGNGDTVVTSTRHLAWHHIDRHSLLAMGRNQLGEEFSFNPQLNLEFPVSQLVPGSFAQLRIWAAGRATPESRLEVRAEGSQLGTIVMPQPSGISTYWRTQATLRLGSFSLPVSSITDGSLSLQLNLLAGSSGRTWLDRVEVEAQRQLEYTASLLPIWATTSSPRNQEFRLQNAPEDLIVWDISTPWQVKAQQTIRNGTALSWTQRVDSLRQWVAFRPSDVRVPIALGGVPNQNLHALPQADYLLVYPTQFRAEAERLADFHRTVMGYRVNAVDLSLIYNEFGSGRQDVSAIRNFTKMFYDRAQTPEDQPRYLLLFGDASYDFRGRVTQRPVVPAYQARNSYDPTDAYCSDDFFGFLDDEEGEWSEGNPQYGDPSSRVQNHGMDLAVGRFPARTPDEARILVDRTIRYVTQTDNTGLWQNRVLLFADYKPGEGSIHMANTEQLYNIAQQESPCLNVSKIYFDNFPIQGTAAGARFPTARQALITDLNRGSLLVNYVGHGGETGLSNSQIFEVPDIASLSNANSLAFWVTATCDFGRHDDPDRKSGAEFLVTNPNGGAIGCLTSVREVFSGQNQVFNSNFFRNVFDFDADLGRYITLGETTQRTKNMSWGVADVNNRNFGLLGDPGIQLAFARYRTVLTDINTRPVEPNAPDTLRALQFVTLRGEVQDRNGERLTSFFGDMDLAVFDKPKQNITREMAFKFFTQDVVLFNGRVSVNAGEFTASFYVPLDISYEIGPGKVSFFASSPQVDAAGCNTDFIVCCTDPNATSNDHPPTVALHMNDLNWVSGGMTDQSPMLIALLADDQGINTTGLGVGRELVAFLNGDERDPIVLNEFYSAKKDSYNEGEVRYRLSGLPEGRYNLRMKVWDVTNNSGEGYTDFVVASDAKLALDNILNYPNPFTTHTTFFFNHNKPGELLEAQVRIFTVSGKMVKTLRSSFFADGNLCNHIDWDGLDEFGDRIGRGVYVYQVVLRQPSTGETAAEYEKLVLLR